MRKGLSEHVKKEIIMRAGFRCEYCLLHESVSFYSFHIDHIHSLKHGGSNNIDNLAYCCPDCNNFKGTDVGTFSDKNKLIRFYNPRIDYWNDHFEINDSAIFAKTDIAEATIRIFKFNDPDRLIFRRQLSELLRYP